MKLTWFGGSTFRIQIGGQVVVIDPQLVVGGIDEAELVSGADRIAVLGEGRATVDPLKWRPRPAERLVDAGDDMRPVELWSAGAGNLLLDGDDDTPVLFLGGAMPELGRWVERAVVVVFGQDLAERAAALLDDRNPRLIALAAGEAEIGRTIAAIRDHLAETGVVALEPGLAVEA